MLKQLRDYAVKYLDSEPGFRCKHAAWALQFAEDGRYLDIVPLRITGGKGDKGRAFPKCPHLSQPAMVAGGRPKAHPLLDTAGRLVLLGVGGADDSARHRFEFWLAMLTDATGRIPALGLLAGALADEPTLARIQDDLLVQKANAADKVTFQIGDEFPVESDAVHAWWRDFRRTLERSPDGEMMRCFITGELVVPALTHDIKIEGLIPVGGRSVGDILVGFDKEAFKSHGLQKSANAACSEDAAADYCLALNDIIASRSHPLAGARVGYWYKEPVVAEDDPMTRLWATDDSGVAEIDARRQARELLKAVESGTRPDLAQNTYFALTMSANDGRVMVHDWMEGQFRELAENVAAWFSDLSIVNWLGTQDAKAPKLERVVTSLLAPRKPKQAYADWVKPVGTARMALWHAAVAKGPIPYSVLARLVVLNRTFWTSGEFEEVTQEHGHPEFGQVISLVHARMGLLKAYHLRKGRQKGGETMSEVHNKVNEAHPSPAYQCGRLMAVLADLQHSALGDVGAGVVQRYYAAASATPALVLGRLTRTAHFHVDKLSPGLAYWYEDKLAGIWVHLRDAVPRTLDLEEQSLFALGYYQQMADMHPSKADSTEAQEAENDE